MNSGSDVSGRLGTRQSTVQDKVRHSKVQDKVKVKGKILHDRVRPTRQGKVQYRVTSKVKVKDGIRDREP